MQLLAGSVLGGGLAAGAAPAEARGLILPVAGGLVAAGADQRTATPLTAVVNEVVTVPAGTGVSLPEPVAGQTLVVFNAGAVTLSVYPAEHGQINHYGANVALSLPARVGQVFLATSRTQWYTLP